MSASSRNQQKRSQREQNMPIVSIVEAPEKPFDEEVYDAVSTAVEIVGRPRAFAGAGEGHLD